MKRAGIKVFGIFAAIGAIGGAAVPAYSAWTVRHNGSYCMPGIGGAVVHDGAGVTTTDLTLAARLYCPVVDTSAMPKSGIVLLNAFVNDQTTISGIVAQACVNFAVTPGSTCGPIQQTGIGTVGTTMMAPQRTVWGVANDADYPFLFFTIPPKQNGKSSYLYGYTIRG